MKLRINGETREVDASPETPLLWVLRDGLRLTGTKYGCGIAACGACTVHVDGRARRACVTPIQGLEGKEIRTIEGVEGRVAEAVQSAWRAIDVPQCGYCQSGQIMSAIALLDGTPPGPDEAGPDEAAIDAAMRGNLCRCNCYARIRRAIRDAAEDLRS